MQGGEEATREDVERIVAGERPIRSLGGGADPLTLAGPGQLPPASLADAVRFARETGEEADVDVSAFLEGMVALNRAEAVTAERDMVPAGVKNGVDTVTHGDFHFTLTAKMS